MSRRRKRDDAWITLIAQLAGIVILLSLISPQVRHIVSTVGIFALWVIGIAVGCLIGFGLYRWNARSQRPHYGNYLTPISETLDPNEGMGALETPVLTPIQPAAALTTPEILDRMRTIDWFQFEKLVALVYERLGYNVTRHGGANPDGGIDLVIEWDGQRTAVQCKQWRTWNVGVKAVREFLGALTDSGIQKGIFITLCGYTSEAKRLAEKHGIEIINETGLAPMLESTDARSDPEALAILGETRKFCPKCESEMILRTATKGQGTGRQFWGCSRYPRCHFTMKIE